MDTSLSYLHGSFYPNGTSLGNYTCVSEALSISIRAESSGEVLVESDVIVNTTSNLFDISLLQFVPRMQPYKLSLHGTIRNGTHSYTATTDLYYLPEKTSGSITKIDHLTGGLLFRNNFTSGHFKPIFPFGFYTSYSSYLELSTQNVQNYANYGFSAIHPIASYSSNVTTILDYMSRIDLPFQYDMRTSYKNVTSVFEQVNLVKNSSALLTYYSADELDGIQDPLNATTNAYNTIASLDKYHPVSLVLNCKNYYFAQYANGADILMEDAYPVGINATYSKWGTVCNSTYGDCGCDDCKGELSDISDRLDDFVKYQEWLGRRRKPTWAVLQQFEGDGYWPRYPTVAETYAMNLLSINHGAKGIISWSFPTEDILASANAAQAKVFTKSPVLDFLTGTQPEPVKISGHDLLDVACWISGGKAMIGIANLDYTNTTSNVSILLPFKATSLTAQPWGNISYSFVNHTLVLSNLSGLSTSLMLFDV